MADYFIQDLRAADDQSFGQLPRNPTFEQTQAVFRFEVDRSKGWDATPPGRECWKLVGFYLRTGPAVFIHKVRKPDESPYPNILVFNHWPGAQKLPEAPNPRYFDNAVAGFTNSSGDTGFGYSGDSVVGQGGGPNYFWVSASPNGEEPQYSDMFAKAGWLGGTNHLTLNGIWERTVKASTDPTPGTKRIVVYNADGTPFGSVALVDGIGPTGQKKLVIHDGATPVAHAILED